MNNTILIVIFCILFNVHFSITHKASRAEYEDADEEIYSDMETSESDNGNKMLNDQHINQPLKYGMEDANAVDRILEEIAKNAESRQEEIDNIKNPYAGDKLKKTKDINNINNNAKDASETNINKGEHRIKIKDIKHINNNANDESETNINKGGHGIKIKDIKHINNNANDASETNVNEGEHRIKIKDIKYINNNANDASDTNINKGGHRIKIKDIKHINNNANDASETNVNEGEHRIKIKDIKYINNNANDASDTNVNAGGHRIKIKDIKNINNANDASETNVNVGGHRIKIKNIKDINNDVYDASETNNREVRFNDETSKKKLSKDMEEEMEKEREAGDAADLFGTNQHYNIPPNFEDFGRRFVWSYPYSEKIGIYDAAEEKFDKTAKQFLESKKAPNKQLTPVKAPPDFVLEIAKQSALLEASKPRNPTNEIIQKDILRTGDYWNDVWTEEVDMNKYLRSGQNERNKFESFKMEMIPGSKLYELISKLKDLSPRLLYVINKNADR